MGEKNDYYAITFFYDKKYIHPFIDIQLQIKQPPEKTGNVTINIINNHEVRGIVDTGATFCGITSRTVIRMGLTSKGEEDLISATGKHSSPVYLFDVIFPDNKIFKNIEAVEISDAHSFDFLIGMNILSQGDMAITNTDEKMVFTFRMPSSGKYIDFENE